MLFENPAVAAKLPFPYTVPPPMQAATAVPNLSATIENGTLISHDLHNLAVIKGEQIPQQQNSQQLQQNTQLVAASTAATITTNNGTTTASHSGSSGRSTPNNTDSAPGKLFVGGLSWQTSAEKLKEYFGMFGNVTDVLIMKDPVTQRSRGFGFITFSDPTSVENVLKVPIHTLDGKKIDPKHATPKNRPKQSNKTKKIFVGGVSQDTSSEEVKAYFNQFGKVEETVMLMDQQTKRHRGFGFVTFENEDVVDRVCEIHFHTIKNKKVECKKAQPKESVTPTAQLLQKRLMLGGLGVRMVPPNQLVGPGSVTQNAMGANSLGSLQVAQAQAQAAQAAAAALQAQQNAAAANFGKVFTAYPPIHSFRYAPYPLPTATASAAPHPSHAQTQATGVPQPQQAHVQQQHQHQHQHQHQPQQAHQPTAMTAATPAGAVPQVANPYQAYMPNVDMASFNNIDWSSMYGMGMYV